MSVRGGQPPIDMILIEKLSEFNSRGGGHIFQKFLKVKSVSIIQVGRGSGLIGTWSHIFAFLTSPLMNDFFLWVGDEIELLLFGNYGLCYNKMLCCLCEV